MAKFEILDPGKIALIQQTKEGRIMQIGLTSDQSGMLHSFLAILSKESPLVQMGEDWDLVLRKGCVKNVFN
jgi:hypothetical protein